MKHRHLILFIVGIVGILLSACTSAPKYRTDLPPVRISRATAENIGRYGAGFATNPYLEPRTTIRGKLNEFFIAKVELNLPAKASVSIIAEMKSADGSAAAKAYARDGFIAFWDSVTSGEPDNDYKTEKKITNISRSCVPYFEFREGAGQTTYFIPFVGKNPIPRPATVYIQVTAGQAEPCVYTFTLE